MLILTRRIGESIAIGDDIKVTVLSVNGNQVRVGIAAPRDVPVHREEVYERISNEKSQRASTDDGPDAKQQLGGGRAA